MVELLSSAASSPLSFTTIAAATRSRSLKLIILQPLRNSAPQDTKAASGFSFNPYSTKLVLVQRRSNVAHQQTDRLRHGDPSASGGTARAALHRRATGWGNPPRRAYGVKTAQAAAAAGPGSFHARS